MRERLRPANAPMAFLADVHGHLDALDAVIAELRRRAIDEIYVAGDLLLGGPDPVGVYKRLQQIGARCVRGLSDSALVEIAPERLAPANARERARAQQFLDTREAIGELVLKYLERLPSSLRIPLVDGSEILVVHGTPLDPSSEISHDLDDDEIAERLAGDPADIVIYGASPVPFQRQIEARRVINVGSVGESPDGETAHYTILTPRMDGVLVEQCFVER